jgi:hypothetical protein
VADYPPTGKATKAEDNYFLLVRGINPLIGTVRADMTVAGRLSDPVMKEPDTDRSLAGRQSCLALLARPLDFRNSGKPAELLTAIKPHHIRRHQGLPEFQI